MFVANSPDPVATTHKIDPYVVGGILVRVRDKLLDLSFSEALRQFNEKVEQV